MAETKKARRTARQTPKRKISDDRDWPPKEHCCCGPKATVWGGTSAKCCVISNKMLEDELLQVRADANASVSPPGGPQVNADGSGGSELRTMLRKDVDLIEAIITYRFEWQATGQCQPLAVRVRVDGQVQADIRCAPDRGHTELTVRKVQKAEEVNSAARDSATATVSVVDCAGNRSDCSFTLGEP